MSLHVSPQTEGSVFSVAGLLSKLMVRCDFPRLFEILDDKHGDHCPCHDDHHNTGNDYACSETLNIMQQAAAMLSSYDTYQQSLQ